MNAANEDVRSILRGWILQTNRAVAPDALRDDTPILEERIVTSVDVMDLILLIEELRGATIDVERLDPAALRDIDSICAAFFAPRGDVDDR